MGFLFYIVGKKLFLDTSYFKFLVYFIYLKKNSLHVLKTRAKIIIPFRLETNTDVMMTSSSFMVMVIVFLPPT